MYMACAGKNSKQTERSTKAALEHKASFAEHVTPGSDRSSNHLRMRPNLPRRFEGLRPLQEAVYSCQKTLDPSLPTSLYVTRTSPTNTPYALAWSVRLACCLVSSFLVRTKAATSCASLKSPIVGLESLL